MSSGAFRFNGLGGRAKMSRQTPFFLLLGALVPIFWFSYRSNRSYRVRFWVIAWTVVLVRVIVQVFGSRMGMSETAVNAVDLGGLIL